MTGLGVVAGLPAEAASLADGRPTPGSLLPLAEGGWLAVAGMGPERATRAAQRLLEQGASALASWGTAAGLSPGLRAGTLVLAERILGPAGSMDTDATWRKTLHGRLAGTLDLHPGPLVQAGGLLLTAAAKAELAAASGAAAADLESAAVATVAARAGVPMVALRVVADDAATPLPRAVAEAADERGDVPAGRVLARTLAHPAGLPELLRLALAYRRVRRSFRTVRRLAGPNLGWSACRPPAVEDLQ